MNTLLALDPGIRGCGVSLFHANELFACAYVKNPVKKGDDPAAVLGMAGAVLTYALGQVAYKSDLNLVFEHPRIYTAAKSKGDNNDLMPLVGVAYAVAAMLDNDPVRVYPHEWKGQTPKDVCHARIRSRLTPAEIHTLESALTKAGSLSHNVLDAVGIGLFQVGRFAAKKAWE